MQIYPQMVLYASAYSVIVRTSVLPGVSCYCKVICAITHFYYTSKRKFQVTLIKRFARFHLCHFGHGCGEAVMKKASTLVTKNNWNL